VQERAWSAPNEEPDWRMKAMLFLNNPEKPVAVLDEVNLVTMNDNHKADPVRISYKSHKLNASKTMIELHRDEKMTIKLEDGRTGNVVLQHNSLDMEGNAVGVLRLLGELSG
jgi:hypothetical protein